MTSDSNEQQEGSWTPFLILLTIITLWKLSSTRWFHMQKVQWKKKLGLRDESLYRDGAAGDGANQRHKRQG
jgi:hypothetical protein